MKENFTDLQLDALCLTQALLGVVSENFRLVSVTRQSAGIIIRILLATHCDEDIEEIDEMKADFEALFPGPVEYDIEVEISEEPIILESPSDSTIVVFRRREL